MLSIIPVAGGKGGVGKTILTVNLGASLAKKGKTVILLDLDLGSSNLHTCLGIRNRFPGIGDFILDSSISLESLIIETGIPRLYFIPGDALVPGAANLAYFTKLRLLKELEGLVADYVFLDLAAGSAFNTLDFFLTSSSGLIVTTPEVTSILNAYSFLKNTLYRLMYRSYRKGSSQREIIRAFSGKKVEEDPTSFGTLMDQLRAAEPEEFRQMKERLQSLYPRVVINMGRGQGDLAVGAKLRDITRKNLGLEMEYIGYIGWEPLMGRSVAERTPLVISRPDIDASRNIDRLADRLVRFGGYEKPRLYEADEDLQLLKENAES
ncbi:MAG: AAA family ATPase [Spirochaetales bacterium]|nr:AAA family ATPase [Spirochaetales bacterium]